MHANDIKLKRNDYLKVVAALTMLIDHAANLSFIVNSDIYIILRIIGRISFPIFAYSIAVGFINTRDLKKYLSRLIICAVISQFPYYLYFKDLLYLNVIFTFLIAVIVMHFIKNKRFIIASIIAIIPILLEILFNLCFDYSTYGVLTVVLFYIYIKDPNKTSLAFTALTVLFSVFRSAHIQYFALLSLPVIYMKPPIYIKTPKYFFYYFYPAHLMLLYLLSLII